MASDERIAGCAAKITEITDALPGVEQFQARQLLLTIISLVSSWWALPQLTMLIFHPEPTGSMQSMCRASLVRQVTLLADSASRALD